MPAMDTMELAQRAIAELAPLGDGLGLRAAMQAAENDTLAPHMLSALLGHELIAGHATMIKLSTKVDRWLALVADDRLPEDQERGSREAVRLAVAAARLSERYRVGLVSLAKLRGWEGFRTGGAGHRVKPGSHGAEGDDLAAAAEIAASLVGDGDGLDDGPHDDPNGGGPKGGARAAAKALQQLQALRNRYGNGHTNGHAKPNGATPPAPTPAGPANRGKLRHGNPSGDFLAAPRCGAQTRAGCACRQPAMANGRCRMHGGKSTGARTEAGLARVRANRLVHGARTAEIIDLRSAAARHGRALRTLARLAKAPTIPQSERSTPCPATVAKKGDTDERRSAQMNTDGIETLRRRAPARSVFIPSYLCSSVANPLPATAQMHRSERPSFARRSELREGGSTPPARRSLGEGGCPATRRVAAG
jgi:hypothetical protein